MRWRRTSTVEELPADPVGEAVAEALVDVLAGATVDVVYSPSGTPLPEPGTEIGAASATGAGPAGWEVTVVARLTDRVARLVGSGEPSTLTELLDALPRAGIRAAARVRHHDVGRAERVEPALRRALRDMVASEVLGEYLAARVGRSVRPDLVADTIEFLIELSGTRVESHALTHGVIVADVLTDGPRLRFAYPGHIRTAKRAPLLFDGQRSVLLVDPDGFARTELQRHRFERLAAASGDGRASDDEWLESGALVADATRALGGVGFFVRADRSVWTFVDGQPLLVRRGEHWTAFPLELSAAIASMIGAGPVTALVARVAFMISGRPQGAILAIVDDPARLDGVVSAKDRYDLRNEIDPPAMRTETRLHHLIDAEDLDEDTLVRLAALDGATVVDRSGRLIAYGAIVTSADSQHEGARTAAAKTLSETALVVLKVSVDGDITVFRGGTAVTTLLGRAPEEP
ncbi:MAG: hypothetical protein ACT4PX_00910 [Actinomycetota bacterium]